MKKTTLYTLLSVFILACATAHAQVPGYMGKRLLITAGVGPAFTIPFSVYDSDGYGSSNAAKFAFKPKFSASLDYTYNRQRTIGFKYSYSGTKLSMPIFAKDTTTYNYPFYSTGNAPAMVGCHSIGLRWSKYISGNLPAPLGLYWGYNLGIGIATFRDVNGAFLNEDSKTTKGTYLTGIYPDLSPYFGVRRGLGKSMMWGFNFDFNLIALTYLGLNFDYDPYYTNSQNSTDNEISFKPAGFFQHKVNRNAAAMSYYYSNLFNFTLEFTFLPK